MAPKLLSARLEGQEEHADLEHLAQLLQILVKAALKAAESGEAEENAAFEALYGV